VGHRHLVAGHGRPYLTGDLLGLGGEVAGYPQVKPALDLCSQMNDLDRHGEVLFKSGVLR
jgi:hypothetical protein